MSTKRWVIENTVKRFPDANRIWGAAKAIKTGASAVSAATIAGGVLIGVVTVGPILWHVYGRSDAPIPISQRLGGSDHGMQEWILSGRRDQDDRQADAARDAAVRDALQGFYVICADGIGTGRRGVYSVRSVRSVEENRLANSGFRHGGISADPARITKLANGQVFQSRDQATRELANLFVAVWKPPLAGGLVGKLKSNGETVTVDDMGAADVALLKSLLKPASP